MKQHIIYLILAAMALASCEINQKDIEPADEFIKIFNHPDQNLAFFSTSIIETSDGGYLFLSAAKDESSIVEFPTATITKVNQLGEYVWGIETDWLAPAPQLVKFENNYAFAAMNTQYDGYLVVVNSLAGTIETTIDLSLDMPLALYGGSDGNFVVLGYDFAGRASIINIYNSAMQAQNSQSVNVNEDLITLVQVHMNKSGEEKPFFIGEWENETQYGYFVNCLSNYTLRTEFFNSTGFRTGGNIFSYLTRDAISSLVNKNNNSYALTRYYSGKTYIATDVEVDPSSSQNFNDFTQTTLNELIFDAKVISRIFTIGQNDYIFFASSTNSNEMVVYQYNLSDNELVHTEYVQFTDKVEVSDMIQDSDDEGLVILGRLFFTGRFLRPVIVKIPVEEIKH